jgi:hypothetical protein
MKSLNFVVKQKKISQKRILDTLMLDAFFQKASLLTSQEGHIKENGKNFHCSFKS